MLHVKLGLVQLWRVAFLKTSIAVFLNFESRRSDLTVVVLEHRVGCPCSGLELAHFVVLLRKTRNASALRHSRM